MTNHPDLFAALAAPFLPTEVKSRSENGRQMSYVTDRTVANRLDDVLGPENWEDSYREAHEFGAACVVCSLTVTLPDGRRVTKTNAGSGAPKGSAPLNIKGVYSDAFKRAAVKFGVARYLYRDGVPAFVAERTPVSAASQARPSATTPAPSDLGWVHRAPAVPSAVNGSHSNGNGQARTGKPVVTVDAPEIPDPRTGGQFFKFLKVREEQDGCAGLIKYLNQWGKLQGFPGRIVDWDGDTVRLALAEARRKLAEIAGRGEAYDEASAN